MAVVIRKLGSREYAYWVRRVGGQVKHAYLGPADDAGVKAKMEVLRSQTSLPPALYPLFWDTNPTSVNVKKHSGYILERILELGSLESMHWAQKVYPGSRILEVLHTSRSISEKSKNFWNLWLGGD